jgi:cation diffusion facilitator family transporter
MAGCGCEVEITDRSQARVLWILLSINALMFVIELGVGLLAESTALTADAMDMLADAIVYGIGLYAVGRAATAKIHAARLSGQFQIALGIAVLLDVIRRFITGSEPDYAYMFGVGLLALLANMVCLILIAKHRNGEVHMRASWIFSKNDVIANLSVIGAAGLVYWSGSSLPDLIVGLLVSLLVVWGGRMIIADARREQQALESPSCSGGGCCG